MMVHSHTMRLMYQVLDEEDTTRSDLIETGQRFFEALYVHTLGITMNDARYRIYSRKKGKPIRIMALPLQKRPYISKCSQ